MLLKTIRNIVILSLFISFFVFILATENGLQVTISFIKYFIPGHLKISEIHGTFLDKIIIKNLSYESNEKKIIIKDIKLDWQFSNWEDNFIKIKSLKITGINLKIQTSSTPISLEEGIILISGSLNHYKIHCNTQFSLPDASKNQFNSFGSGNLKSIYFNKIDLQILKNHITAKLKLKWKPNLYAEMEAEQDQFIFPKTHIALKKIQTIIKGNPRKTLNIQFSTEMNKEKIFVSGNTRFIKNNVDAKLTLKSNNLPIIQNEEYKIYASPQLTFTLHNHDMKVTGQVLIPHAEIIVPDVGNTVELPADVVFEEDHQKMNLQSFPIEFNIQLILGDQVKIKAKGFEGLLHGELKIQRLKNQITKTNGIIYMTQGKYRSYGQTLNVERGQLIYLGNPFDNPTLNIRASKNVVSGSGLPSMLDNLNIPALSQIKTSASKVGIIVKGELKNPQIKMFSQPAGLSDSDILSYLVLNRPINQVSATDAGLLFNTLLAINPTGKASSITRLQQEITQKLGIEFSVSNTEVRDQLTGNLIQSTAIMFGKALTPQLYLSYTYATTTANYLIKLRYSFSKHWAVQTETDGEANRIDVLFTKGH